MLTAVPPEAGTTSHGRYSVDLYADTHWQDIHDHGIVYFDIDSPGVKGATVYVARHQMAEVSEFNEAMTTEVTVVRRHAAPTRNLPSASAATNMLLSTCRSAPPTSRSGASD